ncbi:cell division protein FtsZ [Hydrogenophaga sp. 5NK40-0174]|uniref:cell division protein FtsZ n=1 Tax=Hydrogenophaga sp. 5NK40-0174 TaxID=3127649 RepID=UPI003101BE3A
MNSFVVSLGIAGGLILAGVVAYNAWLTSRNAPRTAREEPETDESAASAAAPMAGSTQDSLAPADYHERIEPVLGDMPAGQEEQRSDPVMTMDQSSSEASLTALDHMPQPNQRNAPVREATAEDAAERPSGQRVAAEPAQEAGKQAGRVAVTLNTVVESRPGLDALIDSITPLQLDAPVSGEAVLAAYPSTRRVGSKAFAIEGQKAPGTDWVSPKPGERYVALQAGVQLANRSGALNDIEFSEYVMKTQAFADAVNAAPDFPDMRGEVARARELDAFASGHDAQLSITLRARRAAWSPGYVQQHAAKLGFVAGALPGRMVLAGSTPGAAPILVLGFDPQAAMAEDPEQSALREIRLSLELTHVPREDQPFGKLRQASTALAEEMDGIVSDDAGQVLTAETMDGIGADVENLYEALEDRDLAAGSPQARRLFS